MNKEDIIRLAREAGFNTDHDLICIEGWEISPYMQRFAELVAAHEREACARLCDEADNPWSLAAAIRARGQNDAT